jgi:hypothetical protein
VQIYSLSSKAETKKPTSIHTRQKRHRSDPELGQFGLGTIEKREKKRKNSI